MSEFIPVGRTSLAKRGNTTLQVQTEYAARPNPRIATTITENGRVVHKVERPLEKAVASAEEQRTTEAQMRQQHATIVSTIEGRKETDKSDTGKIEVKRSGLTPLVSTDETAPPVVVDTRESISVNANTQQQDDVTVTTVRSEPRHVTLSIPSQENLILRPFAATHREPVVEENAVRARLLSDSSKIDQKNSTLPGNVAEIDLPVAENIMDRLQNVPGVQRIFEIDHRGNFTTADKTTAEFRKLFAPVLKNLRSLLTLFVAMEDGSREKGFHPVDPGRLYLVSSGESFFIVLIYAVDNPTEVEKRLRAAL